ncbi:hypothetical protein FOMG_12968 [Fusarium oxysporum f. sp. melonis 26406]|uniref:Ras family, other n=1 Tax=Fusarium oxysporum f. sp. melonis 26406 TaxID=1089452 RepID=W9ZRN0_FUSOX|nr:hypothetical protein FOMG_12968 [Fusarium oxysporum f. sp. melonis 26406]
MPRHYHYQPSRELHVVVLGAGGVGKSCLTGELSFSLRLRLPLVPCSSCCCACVPPLHPQSYYASLSSPLQHKAHARTAQFVHNEWIESYDPTIEDSYRTQLQVDGRQVILEILDTAGTEQFGRSSLSQQLSHDPRTDVGTVAMRDLYMKTGQGFLLVFSITSSSSLSELAGLREEIIRIKDDENVPLVIVGNKADLEENRAVPRAKGFSISQRWGAPYYEASARTRTNVDEVFIDLCRQMLRKEDEQHANDGPNEDYKYDHGRSSHRRQRRRRKKDSPRCVIL